MSKRAIAFKLFAEGKTNLSPEIKALGLKGQTRYNYFRDWREEQKNPKQKEPNTSTTGEKTQGGESIGSIDETKKPAGKPVPPPEEANPEEVPPPEEANPEAVEDGIGGVDEVGGKKKERSKGEIVISGQGIKCIVFLSKATLALHEIAATEQARLSKNGNGVLLLGDFLDTCAETFFSDRGLKLGLIKIN